MSCGCWLFQTTHITERKSNRSLQHTPLCDTHHCRPCRLQVHHPMSSIHILHAVIAHGDAPWPLSPQTSEIYFFARAQAWTGCHWATGFSCMSHKTQGHKRPETVWNCSLLMRSGMIWLNYSTSLLTDRQDHTVIQVLLDQGFQDALNIRLEHTPSPSTPYMKRILSFFTESGKEYCSRELLDCIYLEWVWMVQRILVSIRIKPATMASWFIVFGRILHSLHIISQFSGLEFWPHTCHTCTQLKWIPWIPMAIGLFRSDDLHCIVPCNGGKRMKKGP